MPIKNLNSPAGSEFQAGANVVIQGEGFLPSAEIWFSPVVLKSENVARIQALNIQVTAASISFTIPESIMGSFEIVLKQDGKEYVLGILKIEKRKIAFYAFCYGQDKHELVKLDLKKGEGIWTGIKIPGIVNRNGAGFDENNEFVIFDSRPVATVYKGNLETKSVKAITLENLNGVGSFRDMILR